MATIEFYMGRIMNATEIDNTFNKIRIRKHGSNWIEALAYDGRLRPDPAEGDLWVTDGNGRDFQLGDMSFAYIRHSQGLMKVFVPNGDDFKYESIGCFGIDPHSGKCTFYHENLGAVFSISNHPDFPIGGEVPAGVRMGKTSGGCYVATCVYGSYNCPEVWTLRRFRDNLLKHSWIGLNFIYIYYFISPKIVKSVGAYTWFNKLCKPLLDKLVQRLQIMGFNDTPYHD